MRTPGHLRLRGRLCRKDERRKIRGDRGAGFDKIIIKFPPREKKAERVLTKTRSAFYI